MVGRFIVFEGPEGSGKSTQVRRIATKLRARGREVVATREPGGTAIGESIRSILFGPDSHAILPATEAFLYAAARAQHVGEVIEPALERGAIVLCDRFVDSSLAYQAGGYGLPMDAVQAIQPLATKGIEADLRILLDLPVELGLARRAVDGASVNRVDLAHPEFHRRVRQTYHELVAANRGRWLVIDAAKPADQVEAEISAAIDVVLTDTGQSRP